MVTFVLYCRKYCFKRLKFTFFYLVTRADNNASSDDSVYEKLRIRATTLKRIDAFSNVSGFRSVFKCLRFRKRRPPFSIVAVWSRGENVSKTMRFQMKTH